MAVDEPKTLCRTPNADKPGTTRILTWKFDLLRGHILTVVGDAGPGGLLFKDLPSSVGALLTADEVARLGSIGWHITTVKLEMEVAKDIKRLKGASPQRLVLS